MRYLPALTILVLLSAGVQANAGDLAPMMNKPGKVVYQNAFEKAGEIDKQEWQKRQGTRWEVAGGVLRGKESSQEYQAQRPHHKGLEPRVKSLKTPRQFIAKFSVRYIGGEETNLLPLIEFGHHNVRLKFSKDGVKMLADHESVQLAETADLKLQSGQWYHLIAERNGDEFVVQFADGPTLYAKHKSLAIPVADDTDGLGIAGTRKGVIEVDNVTLWDVLPGHASTWKQLRTSLHRAEPKQLEKKAKKPAKTKS